MSTLSHRHSGFAFRQSALRHANMDRVAIGHALVDNCSSLEACDAMIAHAKAGGQPAFAATANAQHIVLLDGDLRLRKIYDHADLVVPDGVSLLLAARIFGRCLQERVTGVDMFQTLCGLAADNKLHVFLLGGRPGSADLAAKTLKQRFPNLQISTYCPPLGFERNAKDLEDTAQAIRATNPDLLFVALGAPKQEYWIYEHGLQLAVPISVGVGGTFEMIAGVVRRAPLWIQKVNCEWLYRMCLEPRRLWRRYLIGNLQFCAIVVRQYIRRVFLNIFFALVDTDSFAAELREARLQYKCELALSSISLPPGKISESHRYDDALAG
jgi:N-acetylglucosaminyldiphosphoundecaprenol N-acetyl-beta-D-mannosaminyltransferase